MRTKATYVRHCCFPVITTCRHWIIGTVGSSNGSRNEHLTSSSGACHMMILPPLRIQVKTRTKQLILLDSQVVAVE
jgi:hypothetical protein